MLKVEYTPRSSPGSELIFNGPGGFKLYFDTYLGILVTDFTRKCLLQVSRFLWIHNDVAWTVVMEI